MVTLFTVDEFKATHASLVTETFSSNGLFSKLLAKFKDDFDSGAFTNDQVAIAKAEFYSNAYATMESSISKNSIEILKAKLDIKEWELLQSKIDLVVREMYGFDDNLWVKKCEFNGNVASFAINANATNAQDVLDRFNSSIDNIVNNNIIGIVKINPIANTDALVSGRLISRYFNIDDVVTVTANAIVYSTTLDVNGFFTIAVNTADLIATQSVSVVIVVTDDNANTLNLSDNEVVL